MRFIRRTNKEQYTEDQIVTISIGSGGGTDTDTIENLPKDPDTAIEVELDDGTTVVLLGYLRK